MKLNEDKEEEEALSAMEVDTDYRQNYVSNWLLLLTQQRKETMERRARKDKERERERERDTVIVSWCDLRVLHHQRERESAKKKRNNDHTRERDDDNDRYHYTPPEIDMEIERQVAESRERMCRTRW